MKIQIGEQQYEIGSTAQNLIFWFGLFTLAFILTWLIT